MADWKQLARQAVSAALRARRRVGLAPWQPVCVLDAAERLGVEVRLTDIPSMEGIYCRNGRPTIILSTLRPVGRQNFTCAHELGHHVFGHGEQFDELMEQKTDHRRRDPKEFLADCFAGAFLMPKAVVSRAFTARQIDPMQCSPAAIYRVANWLGVGYGTLIHQLCLGLEMIDRQRATELDKIQPSEIRTGLIGVHKSSHLVVADNCWTDVAIDLQIGDLLLLPVDTSTEGAVLSSEPGLVNTSCVQQAVAPGIGRLASGDSWCCFVRVRRKDYVGLARHRFEEEVDNDW